MTTAQRPTRLEVNCTTGEETIIELTDEEIAAQRAYAEARLAEDKARLEAEEAKAAAKASAIAKLAALGLTEDEAAALAS
jgi:DNA-binding transcriptional regulator YhcF (GntR family)